MCHRNSSARRIDGCGALVFLFLVSIRGQPALSSCLPRQAAMTCSSIPGNHRVTKTSILCLTTSSISTLAITSYKELDTPSGNKYDLKTESNDKLQLSASSHLLPLTSTPLMTPAPWTSSASMRGPPAPSPSTDMRRRLIPAVERAQVAPACSQNKQPCCREGQPNACLSARSRIGVGGWTRNERHGEATRKHNACSPPRNKKGDKEKRRINTAK